MNYLLSYMLKRKFLLLLVMCLPSLWLLIQMDLRRHLEGPFTSLHSQVIHKFSVPRSSLLQSTGVPRKSEFIINTIGCRIPNLDPFDDSIKQYVFDEKPIVCDALHPFPLVESNTTSLHINQTVLTSHNIDKLMCCYTPFNRIEEKGQNKPNILPRFANYNICFTSEIEVKEEFVKVVCYNNTKVHYKDFHAFVPMKQEVEDRCNNVTHNRDKVSVLVVGVDSVSRLNLYRQMPNTVDFVQHKLKAAEMLGFNKVDDNTFPNLIPVLSGVSIKELQTLCWFNSSTVFDDCPFIWKNFSSAGYRTMYAEDVPWMGTFLYWKAGFRKQPTDYYTEVFHRLCEVEAGHEQRLNSNICTGSRLSAEILLGYTLKYAITMLNKPSFGFVWGTSLSHDFLNLPKFGDNYYEQVFKKLLKIGVFNKTVLIFMSDHGMRLGRIRFTYQGHLEDRLPFLFFVYPDWFQKKYFTAVRNLRKNTRRLTTPFDLHETLKDLINLDSLSETEVKRRSNDLLKTLPRGISLFLPISKNRTCQLAGIEEHWCTCHRRVRVPSNDTTVANSVHYLMKYINDLLTPYPQCSQLELRQIVSKWQEMPAASVGYANYSSGVRYYILTVETVPGNAQLEATVKYNVHKEQYNVTGAISRLDWYGNQSSCVNDFRMKLYCYCLKQR